MKNRIQMKSLVPLLTCLLSSVALALPAMAQGAKPATKILITNVNIFNGKDGKLANGMDVLVEGNKIVKIGKGIKVTARGVTQINGEGRTLTPGFIDVHYHVALASVDYRDAGGSMAPDLDFIGISAALEAGRALQRGFTSLRDVGGASWGAKLSADRDMIPGSRIWPSLRALSQIGGHGDASPRFLEPREFGGPENYAERIQYSRIVTGVDQVTAAVRDNLKRGASQIKMHGAGGVGTEFDPIEGTQFSLEEMRAAVVAAEKFGTYVCVHTYTPEGITQAVKAGVKSIEHGNLVDDATMSLMAKKGVYLSPQILVYESMSPSWTPAQVAKAKHVLAGIKSMFTLAKKYKVKVAFGTDVVWNAEAAKRQNDEFVSRAKYFAPAEVLAQATSISGELLQLSGLRNPYPGRIGVIEEGALADLLLINGNPLEDISILTDPHKNLALIMKDGKIYKNTVK